MSNPHIMPSSPADAAVASTAGTLFDFIGGGLNPMALMGGILGPALGAVTGGPSNASGAADSGAPVNFGPAIIGDGNSTTANPTATDTTTQVPIQPQVGYSPVSTPVYGTGGGASVQPATGLDVSPIALGGAGLAALAAIFLI